MDAQFSILAIGDLTASEFHDAAGWLEQRGARVASSVASARAVIHNGFVPTVLIIAQAWPGEFSEHQIESLRRAAPLARIVSLLGPWREGETRSGRPLAGALGVYWHQWTRLARQLEGRLNEWSACSLPLTASNDERVLAAEQTAHSGPSAGSNASLLIASVARDRPTAQSLADACARRGWQSVWLRKIETETSLDPDAFLLDAASGSEADFSLLTRLQSAYAGCPIITLVDFPRFDDVSRWKAGGATAVISKPFLVHDLLCQIERLLNSAART
jgi:hypothetical protein